jgi:very-short-patch-repair endonuclease
MKCKYCSKEYENHRGCINHETRCKSNPKYKPQLHSEEVKKVLSEKSKANNPMKKKEHRDKLSEAMKKAHSEGRAHNIGMSRWNNKPSWPETFFMKVIQNEFADKDYRREYPFSKYSLDFVWLEKRKVIEIDGDQHDRFEEQKERDTRKDLLLKEEGFEILRIKWKDMHADPKKWIGVAYDFIHSAQANLVEARGC